MQIFVAFVFLEQVEFFTHFETVILKTKLPEPWTCEDYDLRVSQPLYPTTAVSYLILERKT